MRRRLNALFALAAVLAVAVGAGRAMAAIDRTRASSGKTASALLPPPRVGRDSVSRMITSALAASPFTLGSIATAVEAHPAAAELPSPPARELPPVRLKALVGGPPWRAVLSDVPGAGRDLVVRSGDRFGDLVVAAIDRNAVVLLFGDTTWTVRLERTP